MKEIVLIDVRTLEEFERQWNKDMKKLRKQLRTGF